MKPRSESSSEDGVGPGPRLSTKVTIRRRTAREHVREDASLSENVDNALRHLEERASFAARDHCIISAAEDLVHLYVKVRL